MITSSSSIKQGKIDNTRQQKKIKIFIKKDLTNNKRYDILVLKIKKSS